MRDAARDAARAFWAAIGLVVGAGALVLAALVHVAAARGRH